MRTRNLKLFAAASIASACLTGTAAAQNATTGQNTTTGTTAAQEAPSGIDTARYEGRNLPELGWNDTLKRYNFDNDKFIGQRFSATCPPRNIRDKNDDLYGTDVYPSDNPICVAALHAGKITAADGGPFTLQVNPGLESYTGSSRNEVDSANLPGTKRSMVFLDAANTAAADEARAPYIPRVKWDMKFTKSGYAYKKLRGQRFTFNCPAAPSGRLRAITGTDSYSLNAVICVAAVHAGKITKDGGLVHIQMDEGKSKLVGSIRNEIESGNGSGSSGTVSYVDATF
ncbi:LCCL domain-containing protein [Denitrobaculum tricleocarpae]|nr:LCCL domain-containing protein [Denitrobaculum tricleocarpae]